jgi:hypothetical protein
LNRDQKQLVDGRQLRSAVTSLEHRELLSQDEVFHEEIATGAKCPNREAQHQSKKTEHRQESYLNANPIGRLRMLAIKQMRVLANDRASETIPASCSFSSDTGVYLEV